MAKLTPVDYDPFAAGGGSTPKSGLVPVDYDPFTPPVPTPRREALPEEERTLTEALMTRGEPSRTSVGLGGAPLAEGQAGLDEAGLERAATAIGDIPEAVQRGYYGAKTGANILGLEAGVLSPEEAAAGIAESNKAAQAVPMPAKIREGMEELQKANGWAESFEVLKKYPDILPSVVGESVSASLLSGATGLIGGLTGAAIGSTVPVVGTAAGGTTGLSVGVGLGSAATEYASTLNNFLLEKGYDTSDPEQLKAAFANQELMAEARNDAAIRGVAVGVFDALSAGVAGKLFGPVSKVFGKKFGPIAGSTAEVGSQAVTGMGGEATAQLGTKGEITSPSDVLLEGVGEIVPGLGEIAVSKMLPSGKAPPAPPSGPTTPFQVDVTVPILPPTEGGAAVAPTEEQAAILDDVAVLKGAGFEFDDIAAMSSRQRRAEAARIREEGQVQPATLEPEEISYFAPIQQAPAAPSSPEPAVEAQGPEGSIPSPSAPPAAPIAQAPSEQAIDLVEQGVEPLEAMQQAAEVPVEAPVVPAKITETKQPKTFGELFTDAPKDKFGKASRNYGIGNLHFDFETQRDPNETRYLRVSSGDYSDAFTSIHSPGKKVKSTDIYGIEDPTQAEHRKGNMVGIGGLAENIPEPRLANIFKDWLEKRIDKDEALNRIKALPISENVAPAEAPIAVEAPSAAPAPIQAEIPALSVIPNARYGSMTPKMFVSMMTQNPSAAERAKGIAPDAAGKLPIKMTIDPALLPKKGKPQDMIAAMPGAVKEVVVGKEAYKGMSQKQVKAFNDVLAKIEAAGGKVMLEGETPVFEKKKRVRPTKELGSFIASIGGIKGVNNEGVPDGEFKNMRNRRLPGLVRASGGLDLWIALQSAVSAGYYPEWKGIINEARNYDDANQRAKLNKFVGDLEKGGVYPQGGSAVEERRAEIAEEEEKIVFEPYIEEAQAAAERLGIGKDDPIIRQAAQLVYDGQFPTPEDALRALLFDEIESVMPAEDIPALREAIGEENLQDIDEFLASEGIAPLEADYVPEPQPVPEGRPVSGEGGEQVERPRPEVAPEEARPEVAEPVSPPAEEKGVEAEEGIIPFKPVSFVDLAQQVLDEKLGAGYEIKYIRDELRLVTPDNKKLPLESIGFTGGNVDKFAEAIDKYKASLEKAKPSEEKVSDNKPPLSVGKIKFDVTKGLGSIPDNADIRNMGFVVMMKPDKFLRLAQKLENKKEKSLSLVKNAIENGEPIGYPHLTVDFSEDVPKIVGHEGRHRMMVFDQLEPGKEIPVQIFVTGFVNEIKVRAKNITPEQINAFRELAFNEDSDVVSGKNFGSYYLRGEKFEPVTEEKGAEGKPQLVIPGAEKIGGKELAQRRAEAPLRGKAEQQEVGGLFGESNLEQDIFKSVESKQEAPVAKEEAEPARPKIDKWAEDFGRELQRRPVFSNEEVALFYRPKENEYFAATKDGIVAPFDIQEYQSKGQPKFITDEQFQLLLKERRNAEKLDNQLFNENPDGPFANGNFIASENFPKELGKIAVEWAKLANFPKGTNILFTTAEDAYNMDVNGVYRVINSAKISLGDAYGAKISINKPSGESLYHVIVMKDGLPKVKALETLSHEMGHVIEEEIWESISPETKNKIKDAHREWRKKSGKGTVAQIISGRAYKTQKLGLKKREKNLNRPASDMAEGPREYLLSFTEWFADQTARYFNSQEKPLSVVDKFFKRLADALRRFYASIKGQAYVPDAEFKKWLDRHIETVKVTKKKEIDAAFDVNIQYESDTLDRSLTPTYTVPQDGLGAQFMYSVVDRYYDATAIQRAIEAARGSKMPDSLDVEMAIQLMQDKAIAKQNKFFDDKVRPMVAFMQTHKISGEDAGMFLYAQHAPERNLRMAQRDPTRFDGTNGSGMTTQEAIDYMESIPEDRRALLEQLYEDHVKPILRADLDYRVDNGLLTDEAYESYTLPFDQGGYDYYMPLQGFAEEDADASTSIPNVGRGFAVWGKEYKIAAGRVSKAMNPLFSAIQKRMDGIVRVEKNKTDKVIYDLFKKNPNPEVAEVFSEKDLPTRPVLRMDGTIQQVPDFAEARADYTLPLKIGGRQHYIVFNRDNPLASRLVRVLKNLDKDSTDIFSRTIFTLGQFMSKINTQWVPDFFITNMPRDIQDALISLYSTKEGLATNFMAEFTRAGNIVRKVASGTTLSVDEQASYDEWTGSGGRLDFGGFATVAKSADKLEQEFGDIFNREKTTAEQLQRYFKKSGQVTLGAIEAFNQFFDDLTRFSVYRAARKGGMSRDRAAQLARRATVDFRQRGQVMPYVNAFYPYLSAGINGQRNFLRVLRSKKGAKIIGSLMLLGVANSLLGLALSDDDETDPTKKKFYTEINQWERSKSLIIPIPINGKYRKVSLGFMGLFAFGLGDQIVGYLSGNVKAEEAVSNIGTSLLSSFVPFWSGGAVDSITPWVLQPVIELWTNKNWLGNPIYPDKDTRMPQSTQAFEKTPDWAKSAAEFANYWSGGSHTEPGWVDVYPATLEYFANFALQGLKTFTTTSYETFRSFMDGETPEGEKMPFLRRLTTRDTAQRSDYYELRNSIKAGVAQARDLRKIISDKNATAEQKADARTTMRKLTRELGISLTADGVAVKNSLAEQFDKTDERIKKFNEDIKAIQKNDNLTTAEKAERVKQKEAAKEAAMNAARRRYLNRNRPEESPAEQIMDALE